MKKPLFTVLILCLFHFGFSQYNDFDKKLKQFLNQPEYQHAMVGLNIVDLASGKSVYALHPEKLMIPASTLKLVTSASALELLGPDYKFATIVGYTGKIDNETLKGDLIVKGGGDPALGSEYFQDHYFNPDFLEVWTNKIRAAGIERINGNLVLDVSLYDSEFQPPTWIWEDLGNYYGAGTSALSVYDNLFRITFQSPRKEGQPTKIIATYPVVEGIELKNEVVSSTINRDLAYVFGSPFDNFRVIRGTIPKNRRAFTIKASIPQPENLLGKQLKKKLAEQGIFLTGEIVVHKSGELDMKTIYVQESPAVAEIVKILNEESVNLFAEHLVKQFAAEINGKGNRKDGIEIIKKFWHKKGIQKVAWFIEDGSGLSHFNAVSPSMFTNLLIYMATKSENSLVFSNSLPTPGNGTMIYFDEFKFPENSLRAKSGSMTRVRCYAGYLTTNTKTDLAFSIMVNHFSGSHAKLIQEIETLLVQIKNDF